MAHPLAPARLRRRGISLALTLLLWAALLQLVVKLLLAEASGSLGLLASALHTLLLCFSALAGLQSLWQPRLASPIAAVQAVQAPTAPQRDLSGCLETITALLLWALLGFGGISLLGQIWFRSGLLQAEGIQPQAILSTGRSSLHPGLLPLLAILAILGFGLAWLAQVCARRLASRKLAFQSYLFLQDGWLLLIAALGILAQVLGVVPLESIAALGILAMVVGDAWRWLGVHVPHWQGGMAIAPEAIAATAQQVDGILGCQVISCRGLVGRSLTIALELRLHPEFHSLRHQLGRQVCQALEQRYGPSQTQLYLVPNLGGPRRRLNLAQGDEASLE
ncbi:MAG: hypothetical protein HC824_15025 [Synechococcales cyanobacterium RM1_1_8]|nr:hypothetical protein [Synechococcales cyanobacterium RM1_1_8]